MRIATILASVLLASNAMAQGVIFEEGFEGGFSPVGWDIGVILPGFPGAAAK